MKTDQTTKGFSEPLRPVSPDYLKGSTTPPRQHPIRRLLELLIWIPLAAIIFPIIGILCLIAIPFEDEEGESPRWLDLVLD